MKDGLPVGRTAVPVFRYRCTLCDSWLVDAEGAAGSLCPNCDRIECVSLVRQIYRRTA